MNEEDFIKRIHDLKKMVNNSTMPINGEDLKNDLSLIKDYMKMLISISDKQLDINQKFVDAIFMVMQDTAKIKEELAKLVYTFMPTEDRKEFERILRNEKCHKKAVE